jgi:hypothetical protein
VATVAWYLKVQPKVVATVDIQFWAMGEPKHPQQRWEQQELDMGVVQQEQNQR